MSASVTERHVDCKITSKNKMYEMLWNDRLGNHFPWCSAIDWLRSMQRSGYSYSMRFGKELGAPWLYHLDGFDAYRNAFDGNYGCKLEDITVVTMPRGIIHVMNAEVMETAPEGLYLYYSTYPDVMRRSLELGGQEVTGLRADYILKHYLDPCSYVDLRELLVSYPEHAIEFTVFNQDVGVFPHRNTVIWEARDY